MPKEKKKPAKVKCAYCGSNPVPHWVFWYFESADVLLQGFRQFLLYNRFSGRLKAKAASANFDIFFVKLGIALKIVRINRDIGKCKVPRAKVLWEEAVRRGIEMQELLLFGKPFDCYIARKKENTNYKLQTTNHGQIPTSKQRESLILNLKSPIIFSGLPRPQNKSSSRLDLMDDKAVLKKWLVEANLPVPKGGSAWNFRKAKKIFKQIQKLAIVKPRAGSRGRHSTIFVNDEADLKKAFKIAKRLCFWVVVEEQLKGPVYRATLIDFKLCGVLRGDPPQIRGDGEHSIRQLIDTKNEQKPEGVKDIIVDEGMMRFIERAINLKLSSSPAGSSYDIFEYILPAGELLVLSEKIGVNYGGSSSEDYDICHKDNKDLFIKAAKLVGDPIVGFDFIIPDIAKSWKGQRCGFIEANSLPFINLHHDPLLGKARNVAAKVWDMVGM